SQLTVLLLLKAYLPLWQTNCCVLKTASPGLPRTSTHEKLVSLYWGTSKISMKARKCIAPAKYCRYQSVKPLWVVWSTQLVSPWTTSVTSRTKVVVRWNSKHQVLPNANQYTNHSKPV